MKTRPHNSPFICVQSSTEPSYTMDFNQQSQYIASKTKSTPFERIKQSIIQTLKET